VGKTVGKGEGEGVGHLSEKTRKMKKKGERAMRSEDGGLGHEGCFFLFSVLNETGIS
jgi:hypothetical protein